MMGIISEVWGWIFPAGGLLTILGIYLGERKKRESFRARMERRDSLRSQIDTYLGRRDKFDAPKANIVNAKRYEKRFLEPGFKGGNSFNFRGYQQIGAELLSTTDSGIEFIADCVETWIDESGRRTRTRTPVQGPNVFVIGLVPYENIEYFREDGSQWYWRPMFLTRFEGRGLSPYTEYLYRETEGVEMNPFGRGYWPPVDDLGEGPETHAQAWRGVIKSVRTDMQIRRNERRAKKDGLIR